jgi:hypothetical protein
MRTASTVMHRLPLPMALLLAALCAPAHAQPQAPLPPLPPDGDLLLAAGELRQERVVTGAPYCADAVHEIVQTLADGNRIVHQQKSRLCRDGEGRTRQEIERGGRTRVYLHDPRSRESWVLDPQRRSARRLAAGFDGAGLSAEQHAQWQAFGERMREWGRDMSERMRRQAPGASAPPLPPPAPPAVPAPPEAPQPVRIVIDRRDGPLAVPLPPGVPAAPMPPLPPAVAWQSQRLAPRGAGAVTPLGTRQVEGVTANGERTTWTIEAGRVGNEKPIVITREVWTSPELMVTLQSRDFDPRTGEASYRLVNLRRGEPDASLMRVPPDYTGAPASAPSRPARP